MSIIFWFPLIDEDGFGTPSTPEDETVVHEAIYQPVSSPLESFEIYPHSELEVYGVAPHGSIDYYSVGVESNLDIDLEQTMVGPLEQVRGIP